MVEALAGRYATVGELLKDTEEAVAGGRSGREPAMAGAHNTLNAALLPMALTVPSCRP